MVSTTRCCIRLGFIIFTIKLWMLVNEYYNKSNPPSQKQPVVIPASTNKKNFPELSLLSIKTTSFSEVSGNQRNHPVLSQKCYRYDSLLALNTCCKLYEYDRQNVENILICARKSVAWHTFKYSRKTSKMHWMFVGDSHIRNIFDVLIRRLQSPMLRYRKASYKEGHWRPMKTLKVAKYQGIPITVRHLQVPLQITFTWSPFLRLLPNLTTEWLREEERTPPTLVLMGSALHWMRETWDIYKNGSADEAAKIYKEHLLSLATSLRNLADASLVVFKLLDHLPTSTNNLTNIDVYNNIASTVLPEGVTVWDSNIPLSDMYIQECERKRRDTPKTKVWRCKDEKHTGYIIIERYVDMLLNFGCNRILNLGSSYCL